VVGAAPDVGSGQPQRCSGALEQVWVKGEEHLQGALRAAQDLILRTGNGQRQQGQQGQAPAWRWAHVGLVRFKRWPAAIEA